MNSKEFLHKNALKEGDLIELETGTGSITGYVAPSANDRILSLKLPSGYNVGIEVSEGFNAKKLGQKKEFRKPEAKPIPSKQGLPTIAVLHTGGTIASRVDYNSGGVYASFSAQDLATMVPEITQIANIESRLVSNFMSEDMRFSNYQKMARAVQEEAEKGAKGIIIGHGTDTMHYTASALAFMLGNIQAPVLLVGAQRSSDRGSSDAAMNLICAARFIAQTGFVGVAICMHEGTGDDACLILPACKTRKLHTSRRDAFRPVNGTAIARVEYKTGKIEFINQDYARADESKILEAKIGMQEKVALVKTHPNMVPEQFLFFKEQGYKGLVIEGTGLGHSPISLEEGDEKMLNAISELVKSGCVVVMASQCIYGRVQMQVYTNMRKLLAAGVIPAEDMLAETAFIKLAWLLGNYSEEEARKLVGKNLRGEITERTGAQDFGPDEMNK